jgi:hypothetical protein
MDRGLSVHLSTIGGMSMAGAIGVAHGKHASRELEPSADKDCKTRGNLPRFSPWEGKDLRRACVD